MMTKGLDYFKAHHCPQRPWGWIAATRYMSAILKEVRQWLAHDWNLQAYQAGLREMSIVASQNILGQLAAAPELAYELATVYYP